MEPMQPMEPMEPREAGSATVSVSPTSFGFGTAATAAAFSLAASSRSSSNSSSNSSNGSHSNYKCTNTITNTNINNNIYNNNIHNNNIHNIHNINYINTNNNINNHNNNNVNNYVSKSHINNISSNNNNTNTNSNEINQISAAYNKTTTAALPNNSPQMLAHTADMPFHSRKATKLCISLSRTGSTANYHTLLRQPSILDLIDDTTLTSLPFAPPPRTGLRASRKRTNTLESPQDDSSKRNASGDSVSLELSTHTTANGNANTNGPGIAPIRSNSSTLNDGTCLCIDEIVEDESFAYDDDDDDEADETEDPIVLIEDYMATVALPPATPLSSDITRARLAGSRSHTSSLVQLHRKRSLAHFKLRLQLQQLQQQQQQQLQQFQTIDSTHDLETLSGSDTSSLNPWSFTRNLSVNANRKNIEEMLWGKMAACDNLKYCDLCEKPLYEISAILSKKTPSSTDSRIRYEEFICEECIENYEEFFNELNQLGGDIPMEIPEYEYKQLQPHQNQELHEQEQHQRLQERQHARDQKAEQVSVIFRAIQEKYNTLHSNKAAVNPDLRTHHGIKTAAAQVEPLQQYPPQFAQAPEAPKSISHKRNITGELTESKRPKFSQQLLDKLHNLSGDEPSPNGDWLTSIQEKLKWRWRRNGVFPEVQVQVPKHQRIR